MNTIKYELYCLRQGNSLMQIFLATDEHGLTQMIYRWIENYPVINLPLMRDKLCSSVANKTKKAAHY